ncbi:class I SAM-dependent methyltransferase [Colwellia sp. D2M02]|uniref:Methyltransferase domain-containing protein n=1 Tax=Colwellia asteriadis TaxID=517723 RepID=A0ABP3WJ26_9GAMM|nr:class I SAM-dependent methyltransferase [Colwellia sp. D2M02]MBU2892958.1 class I SAM-dependent methyltransferase [Colwellia sp. D2M02]
MKPALAFSLPDSPKSWDDLPNGDIVLSAIEHELAPWWQRFFGYHLLKLGTLSAKITTSNCTIQNQFSITPKDELGNIIADIDDLPLLEHSIDVCLLSHALEFSLDPHHIIREANRVLIPNGYLVITGFNPMSLAGLNRLTPYRRKQSPWTGHFFSPLRIKDWLQLMGYEILADQRCLHTNLMGNISANRLTSTWQQFAQQYLKPFGSVYVIVAKKRVLPLTPIKPKWQLRTGFQPVKVSTMHTPKNQIKSYHQNKK